MSTTNTAGHACRSQDELYRESVREFGAAIGRLARAYEANPSACADLVQEIHLALWRSFKGFDGRCSLRTWVYRIAHNTAASHVGRAFRFSTSKLATLDELDTELGQREPSIEDFAAHQDNLRRLYSLIHALEPLDRQIMICYLEELDAASIGEIVGISAAAVAMKVHRVKRLLTQRFHEVQSHAQSK